LDMIRLLNSDKKIVILDECIGCLDENFSEVMNFVLKKYLKVKNISV